MILIDVKRAVSNNGNVHFVSFKDNVLWYQTDYNELFPVPVEDTAGAEFYPKEKAIFLMRWMNKYNKEIKDTEACA